MNKNRYRLVFNALRAAWMAVPEGARRAVKRSGGAAVACALALDAVAAPALPRGTLPVQSADPARPFVQHGAVAVRTDNTAGGRSMEIDQASRKAVLNWAGFDIAPGSAVRFNQPGADAAVLNKIWSANPSLIQGRLSANGQVYLYNRNGILFDRGAQVNVGGLVASALQIDDARFLDGLLSRIDGSPAFSWDGTLAQYRASMVQVDLGAQIATADGGAVMLFAPRVENRGRIETSDGQAILAAGAKVYLTASRDQRLRGLIVEVDPFSAGATIEHGAVANVKPGDAELSGAAAEVGERLQANGAGGPALTVDQLRHRVGEIFARRGNVTMVAHAVNQSGRVSATTSVNANGSIYLLARDTVSTDPSVDNPATPEVDRPPTKTGTLILGNGSVTAVLPETGAETSIDAQSFNPSVINLMGGKIHLQGNAAIVAPGARVSVAALANPLDPRLAVRGAAANASRIVMDAGSRIDVSGSTDVVVPMERNVITAELFTHELRDAPLQRAGLLYRQKIKYDLRKGTPLADVKAYEEQIGRTARERTAAGGAVAFSSEGDIVVRQGASVNVSGGWLRYADGFITTTLLTSGGRVFDISQATPDRIYDGIHERAPVFTRGYLEGRDAGSVSFASRALALDGALVGRATAGPHQRDARGKVAPPAPGRVRIGAVPTGVSPDLLLPAIRIARETGTLAAGFDAAPRSHSLGARAGE
ncbi:MAG: filamentous hemagglutinin N-terminal domain-containing protein, partial [Sulfuritalea sp.]|nr:filamentous hemagglutinin N-terminal domain-containing protein [Sulfuritalea sp.]